MPKFFQDRGSTIAPHIPPVFTVVLLHTVAIGQRLLRGIVCMYYVIDSLWMPTMLQFVNGSQNDTCCDKHVPYKDSRKCP